MLSQEVHGDRHQLVAFLPAQPPAGKLTYQFGLSLANGQEVLVPQQPVVIRFKGQVPHILLAAHIGAMFAGMYLSNWLGLFALFGGKPGWRWVRACLALFVFGGLILGPFVQKAAFDVYWSGFPLGRDLTDTKTLVFVGAWAWASFLRGKSKRWPVLVAFFLTLAAFLVPHSVWGSEIRWDQ